MVNLDRRGVKLMKLRKFFCLALIFAVAVNCCSVDVSAAGDIGLEGNSAVTYAMGKFSMDVPANTAVKAKTSFPLDVGETVTIKASYAPFSASVDFGVIAPDGLFYSVNVKNGSVDWTIEVSQRGNYTLAVRNNSDEEISVSGYVNY